MALFVVKNGYSGSLPVGVIVDATDEADALTQADAALGALDRGPSYCEGLTAASFTVPYVGEFA